MIEDFVLTSNSQSQRAARSVQQIQHNTADCAGRADQGSTPPAHGEGASTPTGRDKLKEEMRAIIREMIRSGELPPP